MRGEDTSTPETLQLNFELINEDTLPTPQPKCNTFDEEETSPRLHKSNAKLVFDGKASPNILRKIGLLLNPLI
jgi:hypothetical protein